MMRYSTVIGLSVALAISTVAAGDHPALRRGAERTVSGTVTVLQEDDFEGGTSVKRYVLESDSSRVPLRFDRVPDRLRTGDRVEVRGRLIGSELRVEYVEHAPIAMVPTAAVTGDRSVVTLIADFADSTVSCSNGAVGELVYSGAQSVDGLYRDTSFGTLGLVQDADLDGQDDVFRVSISASKNDSCDPYAWATAIDSAATVAGIDLSPFQHRLYVLPSNTQCGWAGLGSLGCWGNCLAWVNTCQLPDVYAHELGHNLGLHHASTDDDNDGGIDCEYCDTSDFMGIGGVGWRQVNGAHKVQMGWLPEGQIVSVDAAADETIVLTALEADPAIATFPQVLRVSPPSGDPYFVSYRTRTGYDQTLSTFYSDRVSVHRHAGGTNNTRWLATLADGQEFHDPGTGFRVTQLSHDADTVTLLVGTGTGCQTAPPSVTISPGSQAGAPGQTLGYAVHVTNHDGLGCSASTFDLAATVPSGWSAAWSAQSLSLAPGASGTATASVTSPSGTDDGASTWTATATAPGASGSATATYTVNGLPPDPPTAVTAEGYGPLAHVSWSAPVGEVVAYRVYRDDAPMGTTQFAFWNDWQLIGGTTYEYRVSAIDSFGRESAPSAPFELSIPIGSEKNAQSGAGKPAPMAFSRSR